MRARTPTLKAMTAAENGELLDAQLTDQSALRDRIEALGAARMSDGDGARSRRRSSPPCALAKRRPSDSEGVR
jgi:hypothetical protein